MSVIPDTDWFYPVPYFKDFYIEAPRGAVFNFEGLKNLLPEDEWKALSLEEQMKNIKAVAEELSANLGNVPIIYNYDPKTWRNY